MSERISRLAISLFALLSVAVAVNLTVLQPLPGSDTRVAVREADYGAVHETAALVVPEIDRGLSSGPTPGGREPVMPGVVQRLVVEPPAADRREIVRAVQAALAAKGYETGGADGLAGPVTQAAILAYEVDHGLPLTAEPSEALVRKIEEGGRGPAGSAGVTPGPKAQALIRSVQQSLARLGYPAGKVDGRLGEATIAAIRDFERQQSMPDTGRISGDLLTRLIRLSAAPRSAERR
jgi:peptidoglycan hydrolase-like protein with peptidoglycan-binding domain